MARKVNILPYDPGWSDAYREEVALISVVIGANLAAAHHIGSTAVPGLAAKPTIDILLVVHDLGLLDACNNEMSELGYYPKGEHGIPGRRYFQKLAGDDHLFHIHAFKAGHPDIARYLNFRDYTIAHPETAEAYQELKQKLAVRFQDRPADYTAGKEAFIRAVDQRATTWRAEENEEHSITQ